MTLPVFADVDTGVDDAFALVYLLASPDAELIGIASTGGNVGIDQVCRNNLGLLALCGATDIPVSRGTDQPLSSPLRTAEDTHGPAGLGYAELPSATEQLTSFDAAEAWVRAARTHPGELVGLATGPLTNLALAVRAEPALPGLLRRLVIMGGSYDYRGNTTPVAEWNFEFHFAQGEGYLAHLHDPLAAAVALDPELIRTRAAPVAVELAGTLTRGMTIADWSGRWGRQPNARVGVEVNPAAFFTRYIDRVGPFARRLAGSGHHS